LPVHGKHEREKFSTREEKLSKQRRTFPIVREFGKIVDRQRGGWMGDCVLARWEIEIFL
jgi:hypothetical protein